MSIEPGTYELGPEDGTLTVETTRRGAAQKAGHDLVMEVTSWSATLVIGDESSLTLTADGASLKVLQGTGGLRKLDDEDKAGIEQTIDEEVLERAGIEFRSSKVERTDDGATVEGELELAGRKQPVSFDLHGDDGHLTGRATVTQSGWGLEPYTALFGTLKVADEVVVAIDARLGS